jgi:hypothetical protein
MLDHNLFVAGDICFTNHTNKPVIFVYPESANNMLNTVLST